MADLQFAHTSVQGDRIVGAPATGPITQWFGESGPGSGPHRGVDLGIPVGTPVYAPAAGKVVAFTNDGSFGNGVCIDHPDTPWYSLYAHLSRVDVSVGDGVAAGQQIGLSGNSGFSTGPHLHWQVCRSTQFPMDPAQSTDPLRFVTDTAGDDMALTEAQIRKITEDVTRRVFDESFPAYFRTLTRAYWLRDEPGAYSAEPDADVVEAMRAKLAPPVGSDDDTKV